MQLLKSNIYHELCHIYLLEKYPKIHKLYNIAKQKEKYIKAFTMLFFIEYLANILSVPLESDSTIKKYINSVNDYSWNFDDWESELFFIKNSPYIIVRKNDKRIINSVKIKNEVLLGKIIALEKIIEEINIKNFDDDYNKLSNLELFINHEFSKYPELRE